MYFVLKLVQNYAEVPRSALSVISIVLSIIATIYPFPLRGKVRKGGILMNYAQY